MLGIIRTIPDNIFSMVATDQQEARALGEYLAREQKGKKISVVYTDSYYRRGIVQEVTAALPAEMKASARFEALLDISSMYDRLAEKLQRDRPDVIYVALDIEQFIELAAKLRKRGVKALIIGGQRLLTRKFWLELRSVADGIYIIAPIGSPAIPELRKTVGVLKQADIIPDLVALNSYAVVQTWAQAVIRAGNGDPRKVIEVLRSSDFQTAIGSVAFDAQGNRRDILHSILTWRDGRPSLVESR